MMLQCCSERRMDDGSMARRAPIDERMTHTHFGVARAEERGFRQPPKPERVAAQTAHRLARKERV